MSKRFALVCVVMFSLVAFGQSSRVTQANNPRIAATPDAAEAATAAATVQAATLSNGWTLTAQQSKHEVADPKLSATVTKPILGGATDPRIGHFNEAADYLVNQMVSNFAEELKQLGTPSPEMPKDLPGSAIDINYQIAMATERVLSIQFHVYYYVTGAAHPNSYTVPINYDFKTDKILTLADLFKPKAAYLTILSDYAVQVLKKQPEIFLFPDGAAAKDENFRSWNITPAGLQITFDPYQVAPYAAGPQQVMVPYSTLKPIIDPAGPLASFVS